MARIRSIKPEFWTDEKIVDLSPVAKLLYIGIWNFADDDGYLADSVRQLQLKVFPGNDYEVGSARSELVEVGLVLEMDSDQGPVLNVPKFRDHQSPKNPTATKFTGLKPRSYPITTPSLPHHYPITTETVGTERRGEEGNRRGVGKDNAHAEARAGFDEFWNLWPRKEGKAKAKAAWDRAVRRASPGSILDGARRLVESPYRPEKQFIPHGTTWLNGDRWDDPAPEPPEAKHDPVQPKKLRLGGPGGLTEEQFYARQEERAATLLAQHA